MTNPSDDTALPLADLIHHRAWMVGFASALVGRDRADDLAHDALLSAVKKPREIREPRAWLATVMRRLSRDQAQGDRARRQKELAVGLQDRSVAERAAAHHDVVSALMKVREPYRETLLLRYFEGLESREIATRLDTGVETVRTRLKRGLKLVRDLLNDQHGQKWRGIVLGLCVAPTALPAAVGAALNAKVVLSAALILIAVAGGFWWLSQPEGVVEDATDAVESAGLETPPAALSEGDEPVAKVIVPVSAAPVAPESSAPIEQPSRPERIAVTQLVDTQGNPLPGVVMRSASPVTVRRQGGSEGWFANGLASRRVSRNLVERLRRDPAAAEKYFAKFEHPEEWRAALLGERIPQRESTTDAMGVIELSLSQARKVKIVSPANAVVGACVPMGRKASESGPIVTKLIAAQTGPISGRVVRSDGSPVASAFIGIEFDLKSVIAQWSQGYFVTDVVAQHVVRSRKDGAFDLHDVPTDVGAIVVVRHRGVVLRRVDVAQLPSAGAEIVVGQGPELSEMLVIKGAVLDDDGAVVPGARVFAAGREQKSDEMGQYSISVSKEEVDLLRRSVDLELLVIAKGYAPTQRALNFGATMPSTLMVDVVLEGSAGQIIGQLTGPAGNPLSGWKVSLADPTLMVASLGMAEEKASGRSLPTTADRRGRFELTGLSRRKYRLRLWGPQGAGHWITEPMSSDAKEVKIVVPEEAMGRPLSGVVRGRRGFEVGAKVELLVPVVLGLTAGSRTETLAETYANERGEFSFAKAGSGSVAVLVSGTNGALSLHRLGEAQRAGGYLEIDHHGDAVLSLRATPRSQSDAVRLIDIAGRPLAGASMIERNLEGFPLIPLPEIASMVVFFAQGVEVARLPIPKVTELVVSLFVP